MDSSLIHMTNKFFIMRGRVEDTINRYSQRAHFFLSDLKTVIIYILYSIEMRLVFSAKIHQNLFFNTCMRVAHRVVYLFTCFVFSSSCSIQ